MVAKQTHISHLLGPSHRKWVEIGLTRLDLPSLEALLFLAKASRVEKDEVKEMDLN